MFPMCGIRARLGVWVVSSSGALAIALVSTAADGQTNSNIEELLARVEQGIAEFYKRAQNVIYLEKSIVQPIGFNYSPEGFARTVESELRIQAEGDDTGLEPRVVRHARKVNGRLPRESDREDRSGCTDPELLSLEPLAFLLPAHRMEYTFTPAGFASDRNRDALLIDFASVDRNSIPQLIEDKGGHDDCFDWSGHIAIEGRVWVDARTYDVLRVDRHNRGPVDVRVPERIQHRHQLDGWVTIAREDVTTRYRTVTFSDPEDVFLVPESIDSVILVRGGLQSTRRSQTFSDYKRFVTEGRIVK
jgi:hypothetical protein